MSNITLTSSAATAPMKPLVPASCHEISRPVHESGMADFYLLCAKWVVPDKDGNRRPQMCWRHNE